MKPTRPTILFALMLISSSCALKPISSEHALLRMEKEDISSESLGNGRVLIYNDANILHTGDNTARLNIVLDDKNLGQLKAKDFVIIQLENGNHVFNIRHLDVVNMRSTHKVVITDTVQIIRVKPTITSNKLEITNEFPNNWDKYGFMSTNN
ncbi:MAG TPA: hypothetical protein DEF18_14590 [Muricauda sp.]|uniref:Auto-transporter adhesin head GIN domain-containing protein n=1 Tax=Flagellimonas aurea TaxID=2915619 RepID=A0ABS3G9U0_9FLAO|nr:hypothetical protein [Allomuricauda aurea]MAO16179.1 hypothetical protein [Allomuricauda sp.]MBO0355673.1 hypothetical protein [Allomuricauda aurea]UBZ13877.1 hypothetical protein LDL77_18585 [Allomuricauda aquimarina]HBU79324.1 hypothetical protein [Allomuricauda sp.]|tara:strand:+ start:108 stop:563 length:456 start_codon:yes stop_codon:yes gene_type:complete